MNAADEIPNETTITAIKEARSGKYADTRKISRDTSKQQFAIIRVIYGHPKTLPVPS